MLELSSEASRLIGILLLALVTVESGGWYLTRLIRGMKPATDFQRAFARAGHGHAAVLLTLGIVTAVLTDATDLDGFLAWLARSGVAIAAILMPAGFFFSSMGSERTSANRLIALVWLGALVLAASLITLGVGLLAT
ncbi:hypothetical protein EF847_02490 [Actinobacteria bacterium YIM 96077]|uniref:DUF2269 domain-containing protein n=1 Tax=Phytoactinopolyspora halophila TaxID=1981511 RepID=A0A329QZG6_9ACTN|nr:hypothetical protein [Phytoactinopolyspora halophila]AYY11761.1 hypothetical protein EF847_02490 [Actinobacteria bacterium YIM 96077]RAW17804.1 hypothetical protein DPM12_02785 [Phytoactinopolyspora halophila]